MKENLITIAAILVLASCGGNKNKAADPLGDSGRTQRTENLLTNLKALGDSGVYLFGHQDDTVYGIGWTGEEDHSDVKGVCNDYPALLSFDLGNIENGDSVNLDGVSFERIRQEVIRHYDQGGMVSLSWTLSETIKNQEQIDPVADFLNSLETPYGVKVPVMLRLRKGQTKEQWKILFERLKERDVVNVLYAYSAEATSIADETTYLEHYPGDEIIDLIGLDCYCDAPEADTTRIAAYATLLDKNLDMVCRVARQHGKAIALTETGYERIKVKDWWTHTLAPMLAHHPICYVLVWSNAHDQPGHYYAPYPGQQSAPDFVRFYNDPKTLFLHDVNGLYLKK